MFASSGVRFASLASFAWFGVVCIIYITRGDAVCVVSVERCTIPPTRREPPSRWGAVHHSHGGTDSCPLHPPDLHPTQGDTILLGLITPGTPVIPGGSECRRRLAALLSHQDVFFHLLSLAKLQSNDQLTEKLQS